MILGDTYRGVTYTVTRTAAGVMPLDGGPVGIVARGIDTGDGIDGDAPLSVVEDAILAAGGAFTFPVKVRDGIVSAWDESGEPDGFAFVRAGFARGMRFGDVGWNVNEAVLSYNAWARDEMYALTVWTVAGARTVRGFHSAAAAQVEGEILLQSLVE